MAAETMLKQHFNERENVTKLINFTTGEGEEIVVRVRQQGAEPGTTDAVRKLLAKIEERKTQWEKAWEEREKALKRKLETFQIIIEKNQINRDIDLLFNEVENRKKNIGTTYEQAQRSLLSFNEITENMTICSENITKWRSTVEKIIQKRRVDHEDASQQQELGDYLNKVDKKWSTLHVCVKDYRDALANANAFCKLNEEVELYVYQKTQIIERLMISKNETKNLKEIEFILNQINQNIEELKKYNETKVTHLSQMANQVFGDNEGPNKVRNVVNKNIDLLNSLTEIKENTETIRISLNEKTKQRTSQIYHESELVDAEVAPDFKKKLESAIVLTGSKFSFECIATGSRPFDVKWFKNGVEIKDSQNVSIDFNDQLGYIGLTIHEASQNDNALYSCRVSNDLGMAETSAYLKIKDVVKPQGSAPLIVTPLESVQLNADSSYTLECIITGEPEPKVTWYKDDVEIDALPEPLRSSFKTGKFMNVRQLNIVNTVPDAHSGTYTCRAQNEYGEAECSCGILIRSKNLIIDKIFIEYLYF